MWGGERGGRGMKGEGWKIVREDVYYTYYKGDCSL